MYETNLKVGEIVILRPKHDSEQRSGFKAFIEEIIVEPTSKDDYQCHFCNDNERTHTGVYSLYGLEPNQFFGDRDWYVGDTLGDDFERTGEMLTIEDLKRLFRKVGESDPRFRQDILRMAKNLGRGSGRNEDKQEELLVS